MSTEQGPPAMAIGAKRVVVHIHANGHYDIHVEIGADVDVYVVAEQYPDDRVYRMTPGAEAATIDAILGDDEIGHAGDSRHAAITNKIDALLDGRPRFSLVETTAPENKRDDDK